MARRHPWTRGFFAILEGLLGFVFVLALAVVLLFAFLPKDSAEDRTLGAVISSIWATPTPSPSSTPSPTPSPTPEMIDGVLKEYYYQTAAPGFEYSDPAQNGLITKVKVYQETAETKP